MMLLIGMSEQQMVMAKQCTIISRMCTTRVKMRSVGLQLEDALQALILYGHAETRTIPV